MTSPKWKVFLVGLCHAVADADGGLLGLGDKVSANEDRHTILVMELIAFDPSEARAATDHVGGLAPSGPAIISPSRSPSRRPRSCAPAGQQAPLLSTHLFAAGRPPPAVEVAGRLPVVSREPFGAATAFIFAAYA